MNVIKARLHRTRFIHQLTNRRAPCEYLSEYLSRRKQKIPPADQILMDPSHKTRKDPSDNVDLNFQAVGLARVLCSSMSRGRNATSLVVY